jgi:hypothetical protein
VVSKCRACLQYDSMSLTEHNGFYESCLYLPQYMVYILSTRLLFHKFPGFYTQNSLFFQFTLNLYFLYRGIIFSYLIPGLLAHTESSSVSATGSKT